MRRAPIVTVLVAESALRREGLARILGRENFRIVASERNMHNLDAGAFAEYNSLLLIVDASPEPSAAIGQIERFKASYPSGCVAVIADHARRAVIISAFQAGANAY